MLVSRHMINDGRIMEISPMVSFQSMGEGEGAVVLTLDTGQLHTCNDTTAAFLSALRPGKTFAEVVAELEQIFDVSPDQLRADLSVLAEKLLDEQIIT